MASGGGFQTSNLEPRILKWLRVGDFKPLKMASGGGFQTS